MRLLLWAALALAAGLVWFFRSRALFESDHAGSLPVDEDVAAENTPQLETEPQTAPMEIGAAHEPLGGRAQELHAKLMELSKEQLYERARRLGVPGRSRMGKQALVKAIAAREAKRSRAG